MNVMGMYGMFLPL